MKYDKLTWFHYRSNERGIVVFITGEGKGNSLNIAIAPKGNPSAVTTYLMTVNSKNTLTITMTFQRGEVVSVQGF